MLVDVDHAAAARALSTPSDGAAVIAVGGGGHGDVGDVALALEQAGGIGAAQGLEAAKTEAASLVLGGRRRGRAGGGGQLVQGQRAARPARDLPPSRTDGIEPEDGLLTRLKEPPRGPARAGKRLRSMVRLSASSVVAADQLAGDDDEDVEGYDQHRQRVELGREMEAEVAGDEDREGLDAAAGEGRDGVFGRR